MTGDHMTGRRAFLGMTATAPFLGSAPLRAENVTLYPDLSEIRISFWFCARRHTNPGRVYPDFSETQV